MQGVGCVWTTARIWRMESETALEIKMGARARPQPECNRSMQRKVPDSDRQFKQFTGYQAPRERPEPGFQGWFQGCRK